MKQALTVIFCVIFLAGLACWKIIDHERVTWGTRITREIQRDRARFERIQRYHGAVAVATDWSHALRLNGEVIRLNPGAPGP